MGRNLIAQAGSGILEFSPEKAGLDVTPANYNFPKVRNRMDNTPLSGMLDQLKRSVNDLTFGENCSAMYQLSFITNESNVSIDQQPTGSLSISNTTRANPKANAKERFNEKNGSSLSRPVETIDLSNAGSYQNVFRSGDNLVEYVKNKLGNELNCSQEKYDALDRKLADING